MLPIGTRVEGARDYQPFTGTIYHVHAELPLVYVQLDTPIFEHGIRIEKVAVSYDPLSRWRGATWVRPLA